MNQCLNFRLNCYLVMKTNVIFMLNNNNNICLIKLKKGNSSWILVLKIG